MHYAIRRSASALLLAISAAVATAYPVTLTDFDGQRITLSKEP